MPIPIKDVVVHVDGSERAGARLDLAVALSRRFGARLTALFAESAVLGSSLLGRRSREHVMEARRTARNAFQGRTSEAGIEGKWWELEADDDHGRMIGSVAVCCRYADLAIFGQHDGEHSRVPEDTIETVVIDSGRPVLVVPSVGRYGDVGKRVLVAWTGSRESARALNDAIPLMARAELVTVLAFQQPSEGMGPSPFPNLDVVGHLAVHGITARYERVVLREDEDLGMVDTLLNRASDVTADLIVMGAHVGRGFPFERLGANAHAILRSLTTPAVLST